MAHSGEILAGRWKLVEKIDAGAMGEIFRGSHQLLGHPVAVKVLIPEVSRDPRATERFLREAQIAAKLQHRHVVRVEDFGIGDDNCPFLVMELLRGESLARRLVRAPRMTVREVRAVVRGVAEALDVAHSAGIVHRDLKPENVYLATEGAGWVVKVLDFGVAKFTDALSAGGGATASNALVGTPRYMSPEQARASRELDGRSDLWSLGMLTYEMLTGQHPFEGEAIAELLVAVLTHRIAEPSSVCSELPPELDDWMARSLARSRHQRYPTGKALADALDEALAQCPQDSWGDADFFNEATVRRPGTLRVRRTSLPEALRPSIPPGLVESPPPAAPAQPLKAGESGPWERPSPAAPKASGQLPGGRALWFAALFAIAAALLLGVGMRGVRGVRRDTPRPAVVAAVLPPALSTTSAVARTPRTTPVAPVATDAGAVVVPAPGVGTAVANDLPPGLREGLRPPRSPRRGPPREGTPAPANATPQAGAVYDPLVI